MDRRINGWYLTGILCILVFVAGFFSCDISSPLLMAIEDAVTAYNKPVADFSASPKSGPAPLIVYFTDKSEGDITSWEWDFGDGGNATIRNPSHSFAEGIYPVRLTVSGPGGIDTKEDLIYALSDIYPIAAITSPKDGQFVKGNTISVTISASAAIDNSPIKEMTLSVNSGPPQSIAVSGLIVTTTFNWIPAGDGAFTLTATAINENDMESDPYTISVTVDNTLPTMSDLTIEPAVFEEIYYVKGTVVISGNANDANFSRIYIYVQEDAKPAFTIDLPGQFNQSWDTRSREFGDGPYIVYARVIDKAGNSASSPKYRVLVDSTPPKGTFTIYSGQKDPELTRSINVILLSDISDGKYGSGMVYMRFKNDERMDVWTSWVPYQPEFKWTLNDIEGKRIVSAEFRDRLQNVVLLEDTILYDPSGIIIIRP